MTNSETLFISLGLVLACISTILLIETRLNPTVIILDQREFVVAASDSSYAIKNRANIICPENDCSEEINSLFKLIPQSGGSIKFSAGTIKIDTGIIIPNNIKVWLKGGFFYGSSGNTVISIE